MPRRVTRTKTAPLPIFDGEVALKREEADSGRSFLSVKDRSLLLMNAAQPEAFKRRDSGSGRRRGSKSEVGDRRMSIGSIDGSDDQAKGDELTGMSLTEKLKLFSQAPTRINRRRTQPVRLEDLVRAENIIQQENIPQPETGCPNVGSLFKQWERRVSITDDQPVGGKRRDSIGSVEGPESPVVRRRASRSILHRMQSFEVNNKEAEAEAEESENRPPLITTDSLDSGKSRGHWTKNEAVARRRARKLDSRYSAVFSSELPRQESSDSAQPPCDTTSDEPKARPRPAKAYGSSRHSTQPITRMELNEASEETSVCSGQSIRQRLANMRTSAESWKNRVSKADSPEKVVQQAIQSSSPDRTPTRSSLSPPSESSVSPQMRSGPRLRAVSTLLENRKSQLEVSKQGWKERVEQKDTEQFTVEGKIRSAGLDPKASPTVTRRSGVDLKRRSPRAISFHGRPSIDDGTVRKTPDHSLNPPPMRRIRLDTSEESEDEAAPPKPAPVREAKEQPPQEVRQVEVPSVVDAKVNEFLSPSRPLDDILNSESPSLEPEAMDSWSEGAAILKSVVRTRPPGRRRKGAGNPVRRRNERTDIFKEEYTEVVPSADREQRKAEVDAIASETKMAALASKENIAEAMGVLKPAEGNRTPARDCLPYKSLMLLHVKGQRHVQVRLVAPVVESMNTGDCFILITPKRVFVWVGTFSNVMEQRRARDLAQFVVKTKGLGYRGLAAHPDEVEAGRPNSEVSRSFWMALNYNEPPHVPGIGGLDEDLWFEQSIVRTNAVYELQGKELVPREDWWGRALSKKMTDSTKAFVFDFGSELYVWLGLQVSPKDRRRALSLGRQLFNSGYDYRGCGFNPLWPMRVDEDEDGNTDTPPNSDSRPQWALLGRITQNAETLLFKTKFTDWPDTDQMVGVKVADKPELPGASAADLDFESSQLGAADVDAMVSYRPPAACLDLDGTKLMRGGSWTVVEDGLRRSFEIDTRSVKMWAATELRKKEMEEASYGQFHVQGTYVVQWKFRLHVGGRRGDEQTNRSSGIGRERTAYFYWLGRDSSITDKGASALFTVELDEEKGPQRRVDDGKEPPALCRLFPLMTVHASRPGAATTLYAVRGDDPHEGYLSEVACRSSALRSRGSFLLVDRRRDAEAVCVLWHGSWSPEHSRQVGRQFCRRLEEAAPPEFGLPGGRLTEWREEEEGEESEELWRLLGETREARKPPEEGVRPGLRIWRLSAAKRHRKCLEAAELVAPHHSLALRTALPFRQDDLYDVPQPELFLVDGGEDACFLWHGWWNQGKLSRPSADAEEDEGKDGDEEEEEEEEAEVTGSRTTGSALSVFTRKRLAALKTAVAFAEKQYGSRRACRVVFAGLEPADFRELFPWWTEWPGVKESQARESRSAKVEEAATLLDRFLTQRFPLRRLTTRPLPEGVDPLFLEHYLDDEEFEQSFQLDRDTFLRLPQWKRDALKKALALF